MLLVEMKALSGACFVRAEHVLAITQTEPTKCSLVMVGGTVVSCVEPVRDVAARLEKALAAEISTKEGS